LNPLAGFDLKTVLRIVRDCYLTGVKITYALRL